MARKHKMMRNPKRHWKPRMLPWFANRPSQQGSLQHWTSLRITRNMVCFRVNCTSSVRIFTVSSSSSSLDEVQIVRASIYRLLKNEKPQNSDLKLRCTSWSKNLSRLTVTKPLSFKIALGLCSCNEGNCNLSREAMCVRFSITASSWRTTQIQYKCQMEVEVHQQFTIPDSMFAWCHVESLGTYQYCKTWESQIIESGWSL